MKCFWEFPGNPVIKTQHFQCWGWGSIPGRKQRSCVVTAKIKKKGKEKEMLSMLPLSRRISHGIEKLSL